MRRDDSRWMGCCRRSLQELRYSADWTRLDMASFVVVGIGVMPVEILMGCERERERTALRQYWFLHRVDFRRARRKSSCIVFLHLMRTESFFDCLPGKHDLLENGFGTG